MFTFGSDPEFLVVLNSLPKSAIGLIKGSIEDRIKINGNEFYYDNVLAECAIKPGSTKQEVVENFRICLKQFAEIVKPYEIVPQASAIFDDSELQHPAARQVGCAKDFCAYDMQQKDGPLKEIAEGNLRSCGGHIHLGDEVLLYDGPEPILAVYMLDLFVGIPSLWLDKDPTSPRRRKLYGQAGRYRAKPYGLEYRSLGNFWLESPKMVELMYDLCKFALECVRNGKAWEFWNFDLDKFYESDDICSAWECLGYDSIALREGINNTDKEKTINHFKLVQSMLPSSLNNALIDAVNRDQEKTMYQHWGI